MSTTKKSGLGRGLGALLQGVDIAAPVTPASTSPASDTPTADTPASSATASRTPANSARANKPGTAAGNTRSETASTESVKPLDNAAPSNPEGLVTDIPVDNIKRGTYQPRVHFDPEALQELADSITAQGLIQPILLRRRGGGYELIAGERRWRAAQLAGLESIPAIVREMDDNAVAAVTLIENIQREDLNPLEEARALHRLKNEFRMTDLAVAEAVGRSRAAVTNLIRLLDLDERVSDMLATGKIEMGHARSVLTLPADEQHAIAMKVYAEGLSVRATEALVRRSGSSSKSQKGGRPAKKQADSHIRALESQLSEKLGASVSIDHKNGGKGCITVKYNSLDELDGILSHIE